MQKTGILNWTPDRRFSPTPRHFLIAILASLPLLALMSRTPASWWVQSGFETYPGTYVRMTSDNYGLCRPWREKMPGTHRTQGIHVTARFGSLSGAQESNFAVVIPANAHVAAIYCGSAAASSPLQDCAVIHCPMPLHIQVEDSIFTGDAASFSASATDMPCPARSPGSASGWNGNNARLPHQGRGTCTRSSVPG